MAKTTGTSAPPDPKANASNRRRFPRRATPFQGVYYRQTGERVPIVGLDLSGGGLSVLVQQKIEDSTGQITIGGVIDKKPFSLSGRLCWADIVKFKGIDHFRYGLRLTQIADGDWDWLMHWTLQTSGLAEGAQLSASQRDNLVTPETQLKIGEELVEKERVDPFAAGRLPLIEYNFLKYTMRSGIPYILLKVRSRYSDRIQHRIDEYFSQILVSCNDGSLKFLD